MFSRFKVIVSMLAAVVLMSLIFAVRVVTVESPQDRFRRTFLSLESGESEGVRETVEMLRRTPGFEEHSELLLAVSLIHSDRSADAVRRLSKLTPTGELRKPLLLYAARSLMDVGRVPEAEAMLRTLLLEDPENAEGHRWLGVLYYDLGAYDFAIREMQILSQLRPDDFRPYRLMGIMYRDFQREADAIEVYEAAMKLGPPPNVAGEIRIEIAKAKIALNQYDDALETLRDLPSTTESESSRARALLGLGRTDDAWKAIQAAIAIDPDDRNVCLIHAELLASESRPTEAVEILRSTVSRFPFDAECRYQLALALRDIGESTLAEAEMERWKHLKDLAGELSQTNFDALSQPHNAEIRDRLAELCSQLGRVELAEMWRQSAAALRSGQSVLNSGSPDVDSPMSPDPK